MDEYAKAAKSAVTASTQTNPSAIMTREILIVQRLRSGLTFLMNELLSAAQAPHL